MQGGFRTVLKPLCIQNEVMVMCPKINVSFTLLFAFFSLWVVMVVVVKAETRMDFDGDGKSDPTVLREENVGNQTFLAYWHVLRSRDGYFSAQWGASMIQQNNELVFEDIFVPADYDGDGKTDFAVWRRPYGTGSTATGFQCYFYILYSGTNNFVAVPWGRSSVVSYVDRPIPQDYDGDGKTDIAIYRVGGGGTYWWILQSSNGVVRSERFGNGNTAEALRGDFDGDRKADLGVARASDSTINAAWNFYVHKSTTGQIIQASLGRVIADFIVPGDFDGDGKTDIALFGNKSFEFSDGYWKYIRSRDGTPVYFKWGLPTDGAVPGDYDGDGITDVAVYRINRFAECNVPSYFYIHRSSDNALQVTQWGSCHDPVSY
jgi:hypothetical protein